MSDRGSSNLQYRSGILLCAVAATMVLSGGLLRPLSGDNHVYQTMGWDLYQYGKLPYLGSWDVNFPGIVYVHALAIACFGGSDLGFRVFDLIIQIATSVLLCTLLMRWTKAWFAVGSGVIYALLYVSLGSTVAGQRDAFAVFLLLGGLSVLFTKRGEVSTKALRVISASFVVSLSLVLRPTYGLFPLSIILARWLTVRRFDRICWQVVAGVALAIGALLLPFILVKDGLREFYRMTILFNIDVYSAYANPSSLFFSSLKHSGAIAATYIGLGLILLATSATRSIAIRSKLSPFVLRLYLFLLLNALISIIVMRKYFPNHFLPFLALVAPLIVYGCISPLILRRRAIEALLIACLVGYISYRLYPRHLVQLFWNGLHSNEGVLAYSYNVIDTDPYTGPSAEFQASAFIEHQSPRVKRLEVISCECPYLRVNARVEAATRFTEILPLVLPTASGAFTSYQLDWQREFVDSLRGVRPEYIVFADNLQRGWSLPSPIEASFRIPGFRDLLQERYRLDTIIHGFTFYRRR